MERNYSQKFPTTIIAIIAVVITVTVVIAAIFAYIASQNPYYGYGGYYGGMMGGFGGVGMIFMIPIALIILVIIGWVIWRGVNWGGGCCGGHSGHDYSPSSDTETAMETLRRRYANGEITREQFEQMKRDIS